MSRRSSSNGAARTNAHNNDPKPCPLTFMDDGKPGGSTNENVKLWLPAAAFPPKEAS